VSAHRQATVVIGEDDLVAAQWLLMRASYRDPRRLAAMALLWVGGTVLLGAMLAVLFSPVVLFLAGLTAVSAFLVPWLMLLLFGRAAARRNLRLVPAFSGPLYYRWDEEGLSSESVTSRSTHRWQVYRRWLEDERLLLLWPHPSTYQVLPKRVLEAAQLEDIRTLLKQRPEPGTSR
jgi:hypothetical protein